jgi:hypothetical protein
MNGGDSWFNSFQVEVRRRMSKGLLLQGSYTFSKAESSFFQSSSDAYQQYRTLRYPGLNKGLSPWDVTHAFKANWIYELPFGAGQRWSPDSSVLNKVVEGWQFQGIARVQTGGPLLLTGGRQTFNSLDAGILLVNMTQKDLEKMVKIRKAPDGTVYWLPQNVIDNSLKAFGLVSGTPDANASYMAPPSTPGEMGGFVYLHGPSFTRFDLTLAKKARITESMNVEFRAEFLNAFNFTNFLIGSASSDVVTTGLDSQTFGQTTNAYRDTSTTNDPGGRIIQFVLRFNF